MVCAVLAPSLARADALPAPPPPASTSAPAAGTPAPAAKPSNSSDAHGCPIPSAGPTKDGKPLPDPAAGASPSPDYPKAGTPGNCRPVAPNLGKPQQIPNANPLGSGPSWWDIPGQIEQAINTWIGDLAQAALAPVMGLFSVALLTEPTLTSGRIAQLWQANAVLADSFYVLYVLFGGLLVLGYGTVQTRYTAGQIVPRLVAGMIASNLSLPVIGLAVEFTGALAGALWNQPLDPAGIGDQVVQVIIGLILMPDGLTQIVMAIFALVICVLALAVLVTCAARIVGLMLLTLLAPLMLATHALPGIDGCARLWWRAMGAVLSTQILQTLTFMLMLQVFSNRHAAILVFPTASGITDFLVGTALLLIMLKIPGWMNRMTLGHSPRTFIGQVLRTAAVAAVGYRLGVPGASSTRTLTSRMVTDRMRGGGPGPAGALPLRQPGPRGPRPAPVGGYRRMPGADSSRLIRAVARDNGGDLVAAAQHVNAISAANPSPSAIAAPSTSSTSGSTTGERKPDSGLASIGGRRFGSSRGSHASGQLALWPVPKGQAVPRPWSGPQQGASPAPPPAATVPGQLQLPGFTRMPPPHSPGPFPTGWRSVPAFTIPRERRATALPHLPEPKPPVAPRPQDFPGQAPLITVRAAKAQSSPPPPKRVRANLAVLFLAPDFPNDGDS
ncbi:hypothetical protein [Actinospica robiniae]|uniref:hypothetical protein n=1 Tax=Actinospica robiniae TaxID=304901 RepID=UPI00041AE079|nr:hypothetical protein [Actinospica robiniae]